MDPAKARAVSPIYGLATPDELRVAIDEDIGQCVHVIARWHVDEVLRAIAIDGPKPLFVVALQEAQFPLDVSWSFHRIADAAGLAAEFQLDQMFPGHPRSIIDDMFNPPAGYVAVLHVDLVFECETQLEKYGFYLLPESLLREKATEYEGLSEARLAWEPQLDHHAWASRL